MADDGNDPTARTRAPDDGTTRYPAPTDRTLAVPPPPPHLLRRPSDPPPAAPDGLPDRSGDADGTVGADGSGDPDEADDDIVVTSYEAVPQPPPYRAEATPGGAPPAPHRAEASPLDQEEVTVPAWATLPDPPSAVGPPAPDASAYPPHDAQGYPPGPDAAGYPPQDAPPPPLPAPAPGRRGGSDRRRRQTLTFLGMFAGVVVLGLLAVAVFAGTLTLPFGGSGGSGTPTPRVCTTPASTIQAAGITRVHVLNGSTRRGLATSTARELQRRGFKVPDAPTNDPSRPAGAAVIRHGPGGLTAARTVATQVKGTVVLQQDERLGEDVDLVLGQTFALVDPAAGAAALKAKAAASPSCSPSAAG
jgi:LytR cell envelope-related transcriptional attenuator